MKLKQDIGVKKIVCMLEYLTCLSINTSAIQSH